MTVSIFAAQRTFTMNFYAPTIPAPGAWRVGQIVSGAAKTRLDCAVQTFDLAAVPTSGPPLPANAIVSLAELLANVTLVLGPAWTTIVARLDDDRTAYVDSQADWNEWQSGSPWRDIGVSGGGDQAAVPAPVTFPFPDFLGDGVVTDGLAPFVTDALQHRGKLLQLRYHITGGATVTERYTLKADPPGDSDSTRLRVTWADPLAAAIDHPEGVTLPGAPPAPAARPSAAGGAHSPAPPARPPRTRRPNR